MSDPYGDTDLVVRGQVGKPGVFGDADPVLAAGPAPVA
jgi:hypothetical protein